jgi:hypothetical protein
MHSLNKPTYLYRMIISTRGLVHFQFNIINHCETDGYSCKDSSSNLLSGRMNKLLMWKRTSVWQAVFATNYHLKMTDLMTTVEETKESFGCIVSIIYQERKQSLEYQHKRTMQCMFVSMLFCLVVVAAIQIGMTRNDKRHPFSTN